MSDNVTIKPQVGVDIAEAIESIAALQKYLEATNTHSMLENLFDLMED